MLREYLIGVIKTSGDAEIENTKSHLNKLNFDIKRLMKIFEDENVFYMKHLFAYFEDAVPGQRAPMTTFDQSMKTVLDEINRLAVQGQRKDELQDALEEHCISALEEQFTELQNEIFENNPTPQVSLKAPKTLETGLSNIFRGTEDQSFKFLLQNIEEAWSFVTSKPCNTLKRTFRLRNILNLGEFASISNVVALSPQVSIYVIQSILNI